jgi:ABC-type multidrug transport system ATPase subunit
LSAAFYAGRSSGLMRISDVKYQLGEFSLHFEHEFSFEKEIYGLIGSNGCGKTTFMKLLAGLYEPAEGHIDYEGLTAQDVTMVFRKPYLLHDTVYRNLVYPLKLRRSEIDEDKVEYFLQMAGLTEKKNQYALSLSSGEQQKLSFIRALIFEPKLILIDEAFSNMDIESVALFEDYILTTQQKSPVTWVIISHQLSNYKRICDYVFFMHKGKLAVHGATNDVLNNPQVPELKNYLNYHV